MAILLKWTIWQNLLMEVGIIKQELSIIKSGILIMTNTSGSAARPQHENKMWELSLHLSMMRIMAGLRRFRIRVFSKMLIARDITI